MDDIPPGPATHAAAGPPATFTLDSDDFGARHDLTAWREIVARELLGIDFKPGGDAPFHAQLKGTALGETMVSSLRMTPADTFRDRARLDTQTGNMVFAWVQGGPVHAGQRGREAVLRPGEGVLLTTAEYGHLNLRQGGVLHAILLPRTHLESTMPDVQDRVMSTLGRASQGMALVTAYSRLVEKQAAQASPMARQLMGVHLADLVLLALHQDARREPAPALGDSEAAARFELVRALIAQRAHDPGLSLPQVASACGLSPRTIQLLFEQGGSSYSRYLQDLRLDCARALLDDPASAHLRIIDIALAAGFSDVSYFNRCFRARFGETPSAARRTR